jgi:hypothetical protein
LGLIRQLPRRRVNYASRKNYTQYHRAFVIDETSGAWSTAQEVPGTAALNTNADARVSSLSCASANSCSAGGDHSSGSGGAFVANTS